MMPPMSGSRAESCPGIPGLHSGGHDDPQRLRSHVGTIAGLRHDIHRPRRPLPMRQF